MYRTSDLRPSGVQISTDQRTGAAMLHEITTHHEAATLKTDLSLFINCRRQNTDVTSPFIN
jgi:hypothetical protein